MALLKQAIAKGYKNAARMKNDKDLDAQHQREDFKKLISDLETRGKNEKPETNQNPGERNRQPKNQEN
jgi:hypothetical protein